MASSVNTNFRLYGSWGFLTEALKTGRNQNEAKDSDVFAVLYADPDRLRGFLAAMSGVSLGAAQAIAAKFPWKDYNPHSPDDAIICSVDAAIQLT